MTRYEVLLFLHLLSAFAMVAALVLFTVVLVGARRVADAPAVRLNPFATALWNAGGLGTLVLGIWLALDVDGYEVWDGWIIAAVVLWGIAGTSGTRLAVAFRDGSGRPTVVYWVAMLATLALLVVMIYKPGA
jgi:hypothetical protein